MNFMKRKPSAYELAYQQQYREVYSRAKMKEAMTAAKRDAMRDARKPLREQPSIRGVLSSASAAASQFAENVEEANRRAGFGVAPARAYGRYAYRERNRR